MQGVQLITELRKDEKNLIIDDALISVNADYMNELNVQSATLTPTIFSGAGTPTGTSTVPGKAGDIYVDTTNSKIYIAKAATGVSDFLILN